MRLSLLGPVLLLASDGPVPLGEPRQQKVAAMLGLDAGHIVTLPRFIDTLWPDRPPVGARQQVQNAVSTVRRTLARAGLPTDVVQTLAGGYRLTSALETDLALVHREADAARAAGDPVATAGHLRTALAQWRGPSLAGLSGGEVGAAAGRLDDLRLALLDECLEAELGFRAPQQLAAELAEVVAGHPLRERSVALLMRALHRTGRRSEALAAYRRLARTLRDDLGIDPGYELQELHRDLLRAGPVPEPGTGPAPRNPPAHRPAQLPPDPDLLTGRSADLDRMDALWRERHARSPRSPSVIVVSGGAGVGKTALALRWAHRVLGDFPDGQLYAQLRGHATVPAREPWAVLADMLRAIGLAPDRIPPDIDAAAALIRDELAGRKLLILLDDAAGAAQVRPLLPANRDCLVLVTSRDRLLGLSVRDGADRIDLAALPHTEGVDLVTSVVGAARAGAEPAAIDELVRLCAGLPLAVRIAAAALADQSDLRIRDYVEALREVGLAQLQVPGDTDAAVAAAFARSLDHMPADARRLFLLFGVAPVVDLTVRSAAALLDTPVAATAPLLRALVAAHLLGAGTDRYTCHDLLRQFATETAVAELPAADRDAAAARITRWYLAHADVATEVLAPAQFRLAVTVGPADTARLRSRDQALAWFDAEWENLASIAMSPPAAGPGPWLFADALQAYLSLRQDSGRLTDVATAGLRAACGAGDLRAQSAMRAALADAAYMRSDHAGATRQYAEAAAVARRAGDDRLAAAALASLGRVCTAAGRLDLAAAHLTEAIAIGERTGSPDGTYQALVNLGALQHERGRCDDSVATSARAAEIARRVGDLDGLGRCLHNLACCETERGNPDRALAYAHEALSVAREAGNTRLMSSANARVAEVLIEAGDAAGSLAYAAESVRLAQAAQAPRWEADALGTLGLARVAGGDPGGLDDLRRGLARVRRISSPHTLVDLLLQLAKAYETCGRPRVAAARAAHARTLATAHGLRGARREADAVLGRLTGAAARQRAVARL